MNLLPATFAVIALGCLAAAPVSAAWPSPLVKQRADPCIYKHTDGYYYFTATVPAYDRLVLRRSKTLAGLATAEEKTIWMKHRDGPMGAHIWAPEVHFIDGKWYIYFAAGGATDVWAIRMYVLECDAANPLDGPWKELGQIKSFAESFTLDASTFEHNGVRYLVWAQHTPPEKTNTDIYIAKLKSPAEIAGTPVRISRPEFNWERVGFSVNEGPVALIRNGRIFLTYSAAATDANYCLGLLTADENADLLDPKSWKKSPEPVMKSDPARKLFGPGHNYFTVDENGRDVLVFHARGYRDIKGDPLNNPDRATYLRYVTYDKDGVPVFTGADE